MPFIANSIEDRDRKAAGDVRRRKTREEPFRDRAYRNDREPRVLRSVEQVVRRRRQNIWAPPRRRPENEAHVENDRPPEPDESGRLRRATAGRAEARRAKAGHQEGKGYISHPIRKADPRKHTKASIPNRSCSFGSCRIKRANAVGTRSAKIARMRKWLVMTSSRRRCRRRRA